MGEKKQNKKQELNQNQFKETYAPEAHIVNTDVLCKGKLFISALLVAAMTFLIYLPAINNNFVVWDDDRYVASNYHIHSLGLNFLKWSITSSYAANWHPLTWVSHAIDYSLWGLNPAGHHLSSIVLHALNVFLLCILSAHLFLSATGKDRPISQAGDTAIGKAVMAGAATALLFGIHPINVESVAWVAERKNVLFTFFVLLSLISYVYYTVRETRNNRSLFYVLSLLFFILAIMSKPMAVTLPVVLLIMDIYPFRRLSLNKKSMKALKNILIEKIPFFIFSIISSFLTIVAQHSGEAMVPFESLPLLVRIGAAIRGLSFYLLKLILPVGLYPFYPISDNLYTLSFEHIISLLVMAGITVFCIREWRRGKKMFAALWAFYVITLLPVIGIVQVGSQAAADRYAYYPGMAFFLLAGSGISNLWERTIQGRYSKILNKNILIFCGIVVFVILSMLTIKQIRVWNNSINLWTHELKKYPDLASAYTYRADALIRMKDYEKALLDLKKAIENNPYLIFAYSTRADAYIAMGEYHKALSDLNMVIKEDPDFAFAYFSRASVYAQMDRYNEAIHDLNTTIKLEPDNPGAYNNLGLIYKDLNDYQSSEKYLSRAIELDPEYSEVYTNRADLYIRLKDYQKGLDDLNKAIAINPDFTGFFSNRCQLHNILGNYDKAVRDCTRAIEIDPRNLTALSERGSAFLSLKKYAEAISDFDTYIAYDSKNPENYFNRGVAYKGRGDFQKAINDFNKATELNPKYSDAHVNLGVTYGELGKFEKAVKEFSLALLLNPKDASAFYNRGAAYYRLNREKDAVKDFKKAARLGDPEIQRILEKRGISW